ncbi:MAG: glycyl-radical enzyme activating protein [Desulfobacteraceae bacterium]|nr:glycyl-radical enzyme activating protein [Desulfobacteraceae bacterium]
MIITNPNLKANIFDIQGLSVHDGPGCRTLIFLKGCTLNCFWCSNPEGISIKPSLMYSQIKCIRCGNCEKNCSNTAIEVKDNKILLARDECISCVNQSCVDECYTNALTLCGYEITIKKLLDIIKRDRQFWGYEGGITLTGGEPLLQIDFVEETLKTCHNLYIHTAIETCGNIPWNNFKRVMPYLDWIFFDIKHSNNNEHKIATGVNNLLILDNAKKLASEFSGKLIFRLPLIPNFNDSEINITNTVSFLNEIKKNEINLLPLHHLGREKYNLLNKIYDMDKYPMPSIKSLKNIKNRFKQNGINCYIGSETPF